MSDDSAHGRARERIRNHFPEEHIPDGRYPKYKTAHPRFQTWCRDEILPRVRTNIANELRDKGSLDEEGCFIDARFVMAKGGGTEIGATKRGKGMKIVAV